MFKTYLFAITCVIMISAVIWFTADSIRTDVIHQSVQFNTFVSACDAHGGEVMRTKYNDYCVRKGTLINF